MSRYLPPLLLLWALVPSFLEGQGRLLLRGNLRGATLTQTRIHARIKDHVSVTEVVQHFSNPNAFQTEGEYIFPLPPGASVSKFTLTSGNKEMQGEVLSGGKARRVYEGIVRKQQDPALLEFLDWGLFKARVFPIPPRGEVALKLRYEVLLEREGGMIRLHHPLTGSGARGNAPGMLLIRVDLENPGPLKTVFSPSHSVDVQRGSNNQAFISHEGVDTGRDFLLYFTTDTRPFGLSVLTHRPAGEAGYFLAILNPGVQFEDEEIEPRDVVLVLDTSGSMEGEKLVQAKGALTYCLNRLDRRDRFNVVCFSTDARPFRKTLMSATPENVNAALNFVKSQTGVGGTNIHDALRQAVLCLDSKKRPGYVLFLTDGRPTIGIKGETAILEAVKAQNRLGKRLFVFGVGHDVNTHFLDTLAEQNRGTRTYVAPRESIEVKVSDFYARVQYPVLSDLALEFEGLTATDVYPRTLPDLFKGAQVVVMGRYTGSGKHTVRLRGVRDEQFHTFNYKARFPEDNKANAFLPRLWAMRKVGHLLDQIRLNGSSHELVRSVVILGKRHGIITPYTSFLVVEDNPRLVAGSGPGDLGDVHSALQAMDTNQSRSNRLGNDLLRRQRGAAATAVSRGANRLRTAGAGQSGAVPYNGPSGSAPPNQGPGSPAPAPTPTPAPTPSGASSAGAAARAGGAGPGAAVSRRVNTRTAGTFEDWEIWWLFNKQPFLNLKRNLFKNQEQTGSGEFFFGRKTKAAARKNRKVVGMQYKTVAGRSFVRVQGTWVDTLYKPELMKKTLVEVEAFSKDYFELLKKHKVLQKLLTVGPRCIVVLEGIAYHIVPQKDPKKK